MPLFSNMHAQLTAIAREFNFPSTAGLCLYLHISEKEFSAAPRISDEVWQFIWNPTVDASAPHKLPIYGKVEFDIDRRKALWYHSWISSLYREEPEVHESQVLGGSYLHAHKDSRTSFADDHETDDTLPPTGRHVPRKLSLLDRFDHLSGSFNSRPVSRPSLSPPLDGRLESHVLSTIIQLEEPKSAKHDLEIRVKSWRASATHQELETQGSPEAIEPRSGNVVLPLDLDDFQWSLSSNGPNDYDPTSPLSWKYDPSIHLANRLEGSVDLTASDATSFFNGSPLHSPAFSYYPLPSPDIAHRMYEDVPLTPSTATSWGPLSLPSPAFGHYYLPSPDLAHRMYEDVPLTPLTATSWGPPLSYPPSPTTSSIAPSIDIGERGLYSRPVTPGPYFDLPQIPLHSVNSFDSYLPSRPEVRSHAESLPWGYVWPYYTSSRPEVKSHTESLPWRYVWPYYSSNRPEVGSHTESLPWGYVWPYYTSVAEGSLPAQASAPACVPSIASVNEPQIAHRDSYLQGAVYPIFEIYRALYPFFNIYPSIAGEMDYSIVHKYSSFASGISYPFQDVYPPIVDIPDHPLPTDLNGHDKRPPLGDFQYPHFNLYPAAAHGYSSESQRATVNSTQYPYIDLYPPVYPFFSLYGRTVPCEDLKIARDIVGNGYRPQFSLDPAKIVVNYPFFNLYPVAYPYVAPYGHFVGETASGCIGQCDTKPSPRSTTPTMNLVDYPVFDIYPAVYPHLIPYPPLHAFVSPPPPSDVQHPGLTVHLNDYPSFNIYPAAYPLLDIYPTSQICPTTTDPAPTVAGINGSIDYPNFNIYPPLYPYIDLYPRLGPMFDIPLAPRAASQTKSTMFAVPARYPKLNIYPPLYPHFDLYSESHDPQDYSVQYPIFNIYPSLYPYFNIYPGLVKCDEQWKIIKIPQSCQYPTFHLYPAVYPHFDIWPPIQPPTIPPSKKPTPNIKAEPFNIQDKRLVELNAQGSVSSLEPARPRAPILKAGRARSSSIFQSRGVAIPSPLKSPGTLRKLPTPPGSDSRPSSAFEIMSGLMANNETSPHIRGSASPTSSVVPQVDRASPPAVIKRDSLVLRKGTSRHSLDARMVPKEPATRPPLPPIPKGIITMINHKS
ncbi:hypothetical protein BD779DRAFT_387941 [Infundibulicybe gibba]|nr:hypothetical protein BD779DRAFT_387941 [Infundibulicybe gibba]